MTKAPPPDRMPDRLERIDYLFNSMPRMLWVAIWKAQGDEPEHTEQDFRPVVEHFFHYRQQPDGSFKLVGLN